MRHSVIHTTVPWRIFEIFLGQNIRLPFQYGYGKGLLQSLDPSIHNIQSLSIPLKFALPTYLCVLNDALVLLQFCEWHSRIFHSFVYFNHEIRKPKLYLRFFPFWLINIQLERLHFKSSKIIIFELIREIHLNLLLNKHWEFMLKES